jgi:hypothetical protein
MSNGASIGVSETDRLVRVEIAAKEQAVARAGVAFSASIREASSAGRGTVRRAVRPILTGLALFAVLGLGVALVRRAPKHRRLGVSAYGRASSAWPDLARAASVAFAAAAARRLAEHWLRSAIDRTRLELPPRAVLPTADEAGGIPKRGSNQSRG